MSLKLRKTPRCLPQDVGMSGDVRTHACALHDSYDQQCSSTRDKSTRSRFQQSPISIFGAGWGSPIVSVLLSPPMPPKRQPGHLLGASGSPYEGPLSSRGVSGLRASTGEGVPASLFLLARREVPAVAGCPTTGDDWWPAMTGVAQPAQEGSIFDTRRRKPCKGKEGDSDMLG